jgi:hypothetical protein
VARMPVLMVRTCALVVGRADARMKPIGIYAGRGPPA